MNYTGRIAGISQNVMNGKLNITFEVNEPFCEEINDISQMNLDIEFKKHRQKRSLDANAYAWVLIQRVAESIHSDKWTVYLEMLKKYSREFTFVICKEKAIDKLKELYRTCVDLGEVSVNGMEGHQIQVYFGSSSFDSKAMSVFVDGIVSECKELGIETMPPAEIERMTKEWAS